MKPNEFVAVLSAGQVSSNAVVAVFFYPGGCQQCWRPRKSLRPFVSWRGNILCLQPRCACPVFRVRATKNLQQIRQTFSSYARPKREAAHILAWQPVRVAAIVGVSVNGKAV